MKQVKKYLNMISPFNNMQDMPYTIYIVKKVLAFFVIYFGAAIVGEAIILSGLAVMGYDPLQGDMPVGNELLPYYGFIIFILLTILYCKQIEKRTMRSIGFTKDVFDYIVGLIVAVILLGAIMGICCITGCISYEGIRENVHYGYLLAMFGGFIIQSMGEEILSRGFLMLSLLKKLSIPLAIFISATVFAFPHFFTLFEMESKFVIIGIMNLYLISVIFSLLVICRSNIWTACGLHGVWNFLLYGVFGLTLSGSDANTAGVLCFHVNEPNILNGGMYGIESGIITTVMLGGVVILLCKYYIKRKVG